MSTFEPLLRNAMITAIDTISKKASQTERAAESAIARLLNRWNEMTLTEKENVAGIVIATATTAVGALVALKSRSKRVKVAKAGAKAGARAAVKAVKKLT